MNKFKVLIFFMFILSLNTYADQQRKIKINPITYSALNLKTCFENEINKKFSNCEFSDINTSQIKNIQDYCLSDPNSNLNIVIDEMTQKGLDLILTYSLNQVVENCQLNQRFEYSNETLTLIPSLETYPLKIDGYNPLTEGDNEEATE